jgi:hypothetical protein
MIEQLDVVRYPRGPGNYTTESITSPTLDTVVEHLRSMEPFEKPILTLQKHADISDGDLMMVNGGSGCFHVQIADNDANWFQAVDPNGSDDVVDVWTSDQGFACERKFTWPLETAIAIVQHYFQTGERHPRYQWE